MPPLLMTLAYVMRFVIDVDTCHLTLGYICRGASHLTLIAWYHSEAGTKWSTFCNWQFQISFSGNVWNDWLLIKISLKFADANTFKEKSAFDKVRFDNTVASEPTTNMHSFERPKNFSLCQIDICQINKDNESVYHLVCNMMWVFYHKNRLRSSNHTSHSVWKSFGTQHTGIAPMELIIRH